MIRTIPEVAEMRPERMRRVVLFPAPLGPRKPMISPCLMEKERSFIAFLWP